MVSPLRTTLTMDPDVAERLKRETASSQQSLNQVINESLRIGSGIQWKPTQKRFKFNAHNSGYRPGVDRVKLNQIVDELEAEGATSMPRS
jgi:hypothetical protein